MGKDFRDWDRGYLVNVTLLNKHKVLVTTKKSIAIGKMAQFNTLYYVEPDEKPTPKVKETSINYPKLLSNSERRLWRLNEDLVVTSDPHSPPVRRLFNVYQVTKHVCMVAGTIQITSYTDEVINCFLVDEQTIAVLIEDLAESLRYTLYRWQKGRQELQQLSDFSAEVRSNKFSHFYLAANKRLYCYFEKPSDEGCKCYLSIYEYDGSGFNKKSHDEIIHLQEEIARSQNRSLAIVNAYVTDDGKTRLELANEVSVCVLDEESLRVCEEIRYQQGKALTLLRKSGSAMQLFDRQQGCSPKDLLFLTLSRRPLPSRPLDVLLEALPSFSYDLVGLVQQYLLLEIIVRECAAKEDVKSAAVPIAGAGSGSPRHSLSLFEGAGPELKDASALLFGKSARPTS